MPPSMNCFQTSYAQIHLTEWKKTPCTLWPIYFKDFFYVENEGFDRQTLQLIPGCDIQYVWHVHDFKCMYFSKNKRLSNSWRSGLP